MRDGGVFIDVASGGSKRHDANFLLLQEGLNNGDSWTLSKAIAILLAKGVSERETLELIVRHMGRHIATHRHENGGHDVARFVNGLNVARRYQPEDRLIPLMMAASAAAGTAGDRPPVEPLPPPVDWPRLAGWVPLLRRRQDVGGDREVPDNRPPPAGTATATSSPCCWSALCSPTSSGNRTT